MCTSELAAALLDFGRVRTKIISTTEKLDLKNIWVASSTKIPSYIAHGLQGILPEYMAGSLTVPEMKRIKWVAASYFTSALPG